MQRLQLQQATSETLLTSKQMTQRTRLLYPKCLMFHQGSMLQEANTSHQVGAQSTQPKHLQSFAHSPHATNRMDWQMWFTNIQTPFSPGLLRSNFSLQKQGNKIPVTVLCKIQCSSKSFLLRNVHSDNQLSGPLPFTFINLSLECSVVENYN